MIIGKIVEARLPVAHTAEQDAAIGPPGERDVVVPAVSKASARVGSARVGAFGVLEHVRRTIVELEYIAAGQTEARTRTDELAQSDAAETVGFELPEFFPPKPVLELVVVPQMHERFGDADCAAQARKVSRSVHEREVALRSKTHSTRSR